MLGSEVSYSDSTPISQGQPQGTRELARVYKKRKPAICESSLWVSKLVKYDELEDFSQTKSHEDCGHGDVLHVVSHDFS